MMMTRLACNQAIESSYWRMDNNSDVGLLTGYVLYQLLIELEIMDLDTFYCDKICMMTTRLACNRAIESSYWRMDNNLDVGLLMGYVLYRLPIELEFMDLDTFSC
jgi:hypothetical protein